MLSQERMTRIPCLAAVLFMLSGCALLSRKDPTTLQASGVVEAVEVSISSEMAGKVRQVFVKEGQLVEPDDPLFALEEEELQLQREQIVAGGEAAVTAAELALLQARQALKELHENWPLRAAQYQVELAQARDALKDANYYLSVRQEGRRASANTIAAAEANLVLADEEVERAQEAYDHASGDAGRALALSNLAAAKQLRDSILRNLNWYHGAPTEIEQALLEADVALAQARLDEAQQEYEKWKDGPDPDQVVLARANVASAEAQLELARVQAASELRALDILLEGSVVRAPMAGVVLIHSVEQGEVIAPGVAVMTLGDVNVLTITVYLAEGQYGKVNIGESASVRVDSFPGESFEAEVVRIADEAEFTPRNVQTEEERQTTVYAIALRVKDPRGKLKPGMPADVVFAINTDK